MSEHKEAVITVNGVTLTDAQSMTIRVALESSATEWFQPDSLGADEHGRFMRTAYLKRVEEIRRSLYSHVREERK